MNEFFGYERPDGGVGIRNHLLVIAPIDCSYEPARQIADQVEGAVAVTQFHGCGANPMVVNTLAGIGRNPNVAGILLFGLGCESLTNDILLEKLASTGKPIESLVIQEDGGTIAAMEKGIRILQQIAQKTSRQKKEAFPFSKLTLAVECGGSDATSGLAANPAVGGAADLVVDAGGTVIFSETSEMIGTQHILARRAVNPKVADDIVAMIEEEEQRLAGVGVNSRFMSKGNIDGGLTTIEEKSLGAVYKGGTRPIQGVLRHDWKGLETPTGPGLWLQDGTGWDVPSITHMAAAGAQIACFTSGKGSTTGHAIVPVVKITGNSETFKNLSDNIDINAGTILNGEESMDNVSRKIFEIVSNTASGEKTKAEALGFKDFVVYSRNWTAEKLLGNC
ncbi:MAG: UxaA family hydrolase [Proteobacteria bacterium]|nr:UxaA family hydrolase [Pseudomonadota bacterium]